MSDQHQIVYGIHAVQALLRHHRHTLLDIHILRRDQNARLRDLAALAGEQGIPLRSAGVTELDRLAGGGRHQGIYVPRSPLA